MEIETREKLGENGEKKAQSLGYSKDKKILKKKVKKKRRE